MRSLHVRLRLLFAALAGMAALARANVAAADGDLSPPPPNVLLLIDTSGSMEYMADGSVVPVDTNGKCTSATLNRWATLVSVLTGTVQNFSCYAQPRTSSTSFETEFTYQGVAPYDLDYHLPFHRILSTDCTPGPGTQSVTWPGWPANAIKFHPWDDTNAACAGNGFEQSADGLIDTFSDRIRFGLMTFDSLSSEGTGASATSVVASTATGKYDPSQLPPLRGMWSYYPGWNSGGTPAKGNPPGCGLDEYEVGARNPAAPPWEGRLAAFGAPDANSATQLANNEQLQLELLAMRPYGATPLAAMMQDARDFIYVDNDDDPLDSTKKFGPKGDPYFTGGCRSTYVIVLSDGEPNLDLRKEGCATGDGVCPYNEPYLIASDMATTGSPNTRVKTFAVGFGLSTAAGVDCTLINSASFAAGGVCENPTGAVAACCTLARIAIEGGTDKAYFADDIGGLKTALSEVLGQIGADQKARTIPAFGTTAAGGSPAVQGNAKAYGYRFASKFDTPKGSPLWIGALARERFDCVSVNGGPKTATIQSIETSKGDNFARNVNSNDGAHPRKFWTIYGDKISGKIHSARSIRPKLVDANIDDGLGLYDGTTSSGGTPASGPTFASDVALKPEALSIDPASVPASCDLFGTGSTAAQCSEMLMRWEVGEVNAGLPTRDVTGCTVNDPISGEQMGCELGSIFHSSPVVVGPPNEFLRDESYDDFAVAQAGRPTVLYVGTTDGQLHAFKVTPNAANEQVKVDQLENNELWSFIPPAVLPKLLTTYNQQAVLLDSPVVVRDVVLERTSAQAIAGTGAGGPQWRTILLAAGGGVGPGYYFALDVTDPLQPEFLWQLSLDFEGADLFGTRVPQPAIATITMQEGSNPPKEISVAIMAGGLDAPSAGTCPREKQPPYPTIDGTVPRTSTRCWDIGPGHSITIARLDTGEVIKTFVSPTKGVITSNLQAARKSDAPFDSPITGIPVPYPSKAGQIANRIYVGDADGTLWRVDLTKPKPSDWTVDMMWDAYVNLAADAGQPIQTQPIVSIDNLGLPIVLFSTGDQDVITATSPTSRLWSIVETLEIAPFKAKEKFHIDMNNGERVTGPISLFAGTAYFSTFAPTAPTTTCTFGTGKLYGVSYLTGAGALQPNNDVWQSFGDNAVVFGVAITQTPSCYDTSSYSSDYFGTSTGPSGGSAGEFQLVYQVSGKDVQNPPGGGSEVFETKVLPSPKVTTRIDSWAGVVE